MYDVYIKPNGIVDWDDDLSKIYISYDAVLLENLRRLGGRGLLFYVPEDVPNDVLDVVGLYAAEIRTYDATNT